MRKIAVILAVVAALAVAAPVAAQEHTSCRDFGLGAAGVARTGTAGEMASALATSDPGALADLVAELQASFCAAP